MTMPPRTKKRPLTPNDQCDYPAVMRAGPTDAGKYRICERPNGHSGRHWTTYCGKRRYWMVKDRP
jgi:hypothetical protein